MICPAITHQILCLSFLVHAVSLPHANQDALTVWWILCCCGALSRNWLGYALPMLKNWHYLRANHNGSELIATASIIINQILLQWIPWRASFLTAKGKSTAAKVTKESSLIKKTLLRCDPVTQHTRSNNMGPLAEKIPSTGIIWWDQWRVLRRSFATSLHPTGQGATTWFSHVTSYIHLWWYEAHACMIARDVSDAIRCMCATDNLLAGVKLN